jgi:ribosome-binding protein aMBF1 (putative translation factor)
MAPRPSRYGVHNPQYLQLWLSYTFERRRTMTTADDDDEFTRLVAKRIRVLRVQRELTQQELADRAGVHRNFVSAVERRACGMDATRLRRIAWALGTTLPALTDESQTWLGEDTGPWV